MPFKGPLRAQRPTDAQLFLPPHFTQALPGSPALPGVQPERVLTLRGTFGQGCHEHTRAAELRSRGGHRPSTQPRDTQRLECPDEPAGQSPALPWQSPSRRNVQPHPWESPCLHNSRAIPRQSTTASSPETLGVPERVPFVSAA